MSNTLVYRISIGKEVSADVLKRIDALVRSHLVVAKVGDISDHSQGNAALVISVFPDQQIVATQASRKVK